MTDSIDLFGRPVGPARISLFGDGEGRFEAPAAAQIDHPARARAKLTMLLEIAREARRMPWPEREARMWQTVFPQMANWLPDEEANQLRLAFNQELERLKAA